ACDRALTSRAYKLEQSIKQACMRALDGTFCFGFGCCKRLNFREDLIFANRLRFAKNRSREQFGAICQHYGSYIRFAKIRTRE
ncbi:MAG: hypothetical protein PV344_03885, partial [Anaplasma sp.]|nr:hypothetical protein [Anaplasma sp.]